MVEGSCWPRCYEGRGGRLDPEVGVWRVDEVLVGSLGGPNPSKCCFFAAFSYLSSFGVLDYKYG
ncbi:hypothetical protein A2U01_0054311, partial [Trifolium medium]|nr:hypothetical protein [Trifolium medium]